MRERKITQKMLTTEESSGISWCENSKAQAERGKNYQFHSRWMTSSFGEELDGDSMAL